MKPRRRGVFGCQFEPLESRHLLACEPVFHCELDTLTKHPSSKWVVRLEGISGDPRGQLMQANALLNVHPSGGSSLLPELAFQRRLGMDGIFRLAAPADVEPSRLIAELSTLPGFMYAEPDQTLQLASTIPAYPRFKSQWSLMNRGRIEADIDATEAWDITTGSDEIVVGVIDTGIDETHPNLTPNLWTNPGEIAGDGIDNDANGYVDDIHGYDFLDDDETPQDVWDHGTDVASVIGGVAADASGQYGVAWHVKMVSLRLWDNTPVAHMSQAIEAINYMTMLRRDYGINVKLTNNSWGMSYEFSRALYDAIDAAREQDILFVAAALNGGVDGKGDDNDLIPHYPSSYDLSNIIAVGATDQFDKQTGYSNFGKTSVDLHAPTQVPSAAVRTGPSAISSGYSELGGTSGATPHVSGAAVLAYALAPTASAADVKEAILKGVDPIGELTTKSVSGGRLNAFGTLQNMGLFVSETTPRQREVLPTVTDGNRPRFDFPVWFSNSLNSELPAPQVFRVNGQAANVVTKVGDRCLVFHFETSPIVQEGPQRMQLAAQSVTRASDAARLARGIDQVFYVDRHPGKLQSTIPASGATIKAPTSQLSFLFDELLSQQYAPKPEDISLSHGHVVSVRVADQNRIVLEITDLGSEGKLHATIKNVIDQYGNRIAPQTATWVVDRTDPLHLRFDAVGHSIAQATYATASGWMNHIADVDEYLVDLVANETLSVAVHSRAPASLTIECRDIEGRLLGSTTAERDNVDTALATLPITKMGQYVIRVVAPTQMIAGIPYTLEVTRNATIDIVSGKANSSSDAAIDLDRTFQSLTGDAVRSVILESRDRNAIDPRRESEPNNTTSQATNAPDAFHAVSQQEYLLTTEGEIAGPNDEDWFALGLFEAGAWLTLRLNFKGTLISGVIELYRRNSTGEFVMLASAQGFGVNASPMIYQQLLLAKDDYFVRVVSSDARSSTGPYELAARLELAPFQSRPLVFLGDVANESENNDLASNATVLKGAWRRVSHVAERTGTVNPEDADYYSYALSQGDRVAVTVRAHARESIDLSLFDAAGDLLTVGQSISDASIDGAAIVSFDVPINGVYVVRVEKRDRMGDYDLSVHLAAIAAPNTPSELTRRWYSFTAAQGVPIAVAYWGSRGDVSSLELFDASGTRLISGSHDSASASSAIRKYISPISQRIWVAVADTQSASFQLFVSQGLILDWEHNNRREQAQDLAGPIALGSVGLGVVPITSEQEPNDQGELGEWETADSFRMANDITGAFALIESTNPGETTYRAVVSGKIARTLPGQYGDPDWFRLHATAGDGLQIQARGVAIGVFDEAGRQVEFADNGQYVANSLPYSGEYYVRACTFRCETTADYTLTVTLRTIHMPDIADNDLFRVSLVAGSYYTLSAVPWEWQPLSEQSLRLRLSLSDSEGRIVAVDDGSIDARSPHVRASVHFRGNR